MDWEAEGSEAWIFLVGLNMKQEIYGCALKGQVWAMILHHDMRGGYASYFAWTCDTAFHEVFRPLRELDAMQ